MCWFLLGWRSGAYLFGSLWPWHWLLTSFLGFSCLKHISYITANFPQMCLMLDQFLWGRSSRDCDISCSKSRHVAYHIKADDAGSNMGATILPTDTPSTQGVGSKGQTISFSESSHVAYQNKGNWTQSTMKANMLSLHTPKPPGVVTKGHFFSSKSSHVAYQIKVEEV